MMATKSRLVKSRRKTTSCLLTPAPGSTETQWWALDRKNRLVKLSGLSKNPTTGDILSKSGGQSGKSLSRSRLKSERYGRRSKKQSRSATFTNNKTGEKFMVEHFLNKPIRRY